MTTEIHAQAEPLACTLTSSDQATRLEEWRALRRDGLVGETRDRLVWTTLWRRGGDVRARLDALIEHEKECCSFLAFEVDELPDVVRVRTRFPAGAEGMLNAFVR